MLYVHILCWLYHLWLSIFPLYFLIIYLLIIVYLSKFVIQLVVCLLLFAFHYLTLGVIFCRIWAYAFTSADIEVAVMSLCSGCNESGLYHSNLVTSSLVVFFSMPDYCSMHPWSPVFTLYCIVECVGKGEIFMQVSASLFYLDSQLLMQHGYCHCYHTV